MASYVDEKVAKLSLDNSKFLEALSEIKKALVSLDVTLQKIGDVKIDASGVTQSMSEVHDAVSDGVEDSRRELESLERSASDADRSLNDIDMGDSVQNVKQGSKEISKSLQNVEEESKKGWFTNFINTATSGLVALGKRIGEVSFHKMGEGMVVAQQQVQQSVSVMDIALGNFFAQQMMRAQQFFSQFTAGWRDGFSEYEEKINSVQTIMSNTAHAGTTMDDVTKSLDELNKYADLTIYNFKDMTKNIGTFTAAGVGLEDAQVAIKGLANLAAASGSSAQQASGAMYQLSQELAAGKMNIQGWNSVVNANMGGKLFQDALAETADAMGVTRDYTKSFKESLTDGWVTAEVLLKTLSKFSEDQSMIDAATKVKTFSQLIETTQEAIGSGWAGTWELIFGNFEQAKEHWTAISEAINDVVSTPLNDFKLPDGTVKDFDNARNAILSVWAALDGRDNMFKGFTNIIKTVAESMATFRNTFYESLGGAENLGKNLAETTKNFEEFTRKVFESKERLEFVEGAARLAAGAIQILGTILSAVGRLYGYAFQGVSAFAKGVMNSLDGLEGFSDTVKDLTEDVSNFIDKLKPSESILKMVTAAGELAGTVFRILGNVVVNVGRAIAAAFPDSLGERFDSFADVMTGGIKSLNEFLKPLAEYKPNFDWITDLSEGFTDIFFNGKNLKSVFDIIGDSVKWLGNLFGAFTKPVNQMNSEMKQINESTKKMGERFDWVKEIFGKLYDFVKPVIEDVINAIKNLNSQDILNGALTYGIFTISNVFKQFGKTFESIRAKFFDDDGGFGFFEKITKGLEDIKDTMTGFIDGMNIMGMSAVALGIAGLAIAIRMLGDVDFLSAAQGLAAIGGATLIMVGAMRKLHAMESKMGVVDKLLLTVIMPIFGSTMIMLAKSMKIIGSMDWEQWGRAVIGFYVMVEEAVIAIKKLSNNIKGFNPLALVLFAGSMLIITKAVERLSKIKFTSLVKSLMGMHMLIMQMTFLFDAMDNVNVSPKASFAVLLAISSLRTMVSQIKKLSEIPWMDLLKGMIGLQSTVYILMSVINNLQQMKINTKSIGKLVLATIAMEGLIRPMQKIAKLEPMSIMTGLLGITTAMAVFALSVNTLDGLQINKNTAKNVLAMTLAMIGMSESIKTLAELDADKMFQGIVGIGTVMLELTLLMNALPKGNNAKSAALSILSMALAVKMMADPIKTIGEMRLGDAAQGVVALGLVMGELVTVMALTKKVGSLKAGAALMMISSALLPLAGAIKILGGLSTEQVATGLAALAVSFGAFIGVAMLVKNAHLTVTLGSLAMTFGMFALSALGTAAALSAVNTAFALIANGTPKTIKALSENLKAFFEEMSKVAPSMAKFVMSIVSEFFKMGPEIMREFFKSLVMSIDVLAEFLPEIMTKIQPVLYDFIDRLIPIVEGLDWVRIANTIVQALGKFIGGALSGLAAVFKPMVEVIGAAFEAILGTIGAFISEVAPGIVAMIEAVSPTVMHLIDAIKEAFIEMLPYIQPIVDTIVQGLVDMGPTLEVVFNGIERVLTVLMPLALKVTETINTALSLLGPTIGTILTSLASLVDSVGNAITSVFATIGDVITGTISAILNGIGSVASGIADIIVGVAQTIESAFSGVAAVLEGVASIFESAFGGIADIINGFFGGIADVLNALADIIKSIGQAALDAGTGFQNLANGVATITSLSLIDMIASLGAVADGLGKIIKASQGGDSDALGAVANLAKALGTIGTSSAEAGIGLGQLVSAFNVLNENTEMFKTVSESITGTFTALGTAITTAGINASGAIQQLAIKIQTIVQTLTAQAPTVRAASSGMARGMVSGFNSNIKNFGNGVSGAINKVIHILGTKGNDAVKKAKDVGEQIANGIAVGMEKGATRVEKAAKRIIDAAAKAAKAKARIHSPSRLFRDEVGIFIGEGIAVGIENSATYVTSAVSNVIDETVGVAQDAYSEVSSILAETLDDIDTTLRPVISPVLDEGAMDNVTSSMNDILGAVHAPMDIPQVQQQNNQAPIQETVINNTYTINAEGNTGDDIVSALRTYEFLNGRPT